MRDRLLYTLAAAGVPADGLAGPEGPGCAVVYPGHATAPQRAAGAAILAAFDWSAAADLAWRDALARQAAADTLTAGEPLARATRAACLALMLSLQEARGRLNQLATWANANGASVPLVQTGDSFEAAMAGVRQLIAAGV